MDNIESKELYEYLKDQNQDQTVFKQVLRQGLVNALKQKDEQSGLDKILKIINKHKKNQRFIIKDSLRGGGACCSSQSQQIVKSSFNDTVVEETKQDEIEGNHQIDEGFMRQFNKYMYTNTEYQSLKQIQDNGQQSDEVKNIIQRLLLNNKEKITTKVNCYRSYVIETFNLCVQYLISGVDFIGLEDNRKITKILDGLVHHFKSNLRIFPCLDLQYVYSFLQALNENDFDRKNERFNEIKLISEFFKTEMLGEVKSLTHLDKKTSKQNFSDENDEEGDEDIILKLKQGAFDTSNQELKHPWEIVQRIREKIMFSKEVIVRQIGVISMEKKKSKLDELSFYISKFNELTEVYECPQLNYIITYLLIQISFILEKQIQQNEQFEKEFNGLSCKSVDQDCQKCIRILKQSFQSSEYLLNFFKFSVQDIYFRFLSIKILLQFYALQFEQEDLLIHLLFCYLTERDNQIKILFQSNRKFCQDFKKKLESDQKEFIIQQVMQYQQDRIHKFEQNKISQNEIQDIVDEIKSVDDFIYKLSLSLIEKWELEARQRIEADIANKDEMLLEVQDLYIDQNITYLEGQDIFFEKDTLENKNAINLIRQFFLTSNEENGYYQCKILTILAESGTGKSMLIKKLETDLMRERTIEQDQNQQEDNFLEKQIFIPFIIKCSSLNPQNPSLDEYFKQQGLEASEIEQLKKLDQNKLILLDGYDEFTGDYFKVYEKLKLEEWKKTLFIVSSRMEKISQSDAKSYFSIYDEQGFIQESSYCLVKLNEFEKKDILEYCNKFSNKFYKQKNQQINSQDEEEICEDDEQIKNKQLQFSQIMEECLKNSQLENLLFLPINLYLFTRLIIEKTSEEIKEMIKNISDQIQVSEIFFKEQFKREAVDFITQYHLDIKNQDIQNQIINSYFLYFQTISMQMYLNKGKQSNFLQLSYDEIQFDFLSIQYLNKKHVELLKYKIKNYVSSQIITRVKDVQKDDDQFNNLCNSQKTIEFKHKSLFEYFVAKAMKQDFDYHQEKIYSLDIEELSKFNINKRIIMTAQKNTSEQQILLKLFKIIKNDIASPSFKKDYLEQDIDKTNRYIQYLRKSQIDKFTEKSIIDIGASNLLSALFLSKFSYPHLSLSKCSFSRAYIPDYSRKQVNFDDCNLENAYIEKQYLSNFETSNTRHAMKSSTKQVFDSLDIYEFQDSIIYKDTIVALTKSGFVNKFQFVEVSNLPYKILQQSQITNSILKRIYLVSQENIFILSTDYSLFEIDCNSLEKLNSYKFSDKISNIVIKDYKCLVLLNNKEIYYGNNKQGFKKLEQIQGDACQITNDTILTSLNNKIYFYSLDNFSLVNSFDFDGDLKISALSPDSKYLATVNQQDFNCKIWNLENGLELLYILESYNSEIVSISFSPNGKYFASGAHDRFCKIFDAEQYFSLVPTNLHQNQSYDNITSVSFSEDGQNFLLTSVAAVKKYSANNNFEDFQIIQSNAQYFESVAFSQDDKYIVTTSFDAFTIWDVQNQFKILHQIKAHQDKINGASFSPDGKYLSTYSMDQTFKIWNAQKQYELLYTIDELQQAIHRATFVSNEKIIITCENGCYTWDIKNGIKQIIDSKGLLFKNSSFSQDFKYLAFGNKDNQVYIYCYQNNQYSKIKTIENENIVSISPNGKYIALSNLDKNLKIFSIERNFELIATAEGHDQKIQSIEFSKDNSYVITSSADETSKIWSIEKGFQLVNTIKGNHNIIQQAIFSNDCKQVATVSYDLSLKVWNIEHQFESIKYVQGHQNTVTSVSFSPNFKFIATTSSDKTCRVYDTQKDFELIHILSEHQANISSCDFSPDSKFLVTVSWDQTIKVFNTQNGFELVNSFEPHNYYISFVRFSSDGRYLATSSWDQTCKIWDVQNEFQLLNTLQPHCQEINQVIFSHDGKYLATCSCDTTCKIWNAQKEFELVSEIQGHNESVVSIEFSKNGKYLVTGSLDNTCKIWDAKNEFQLIKSIESFLSAVSSITFSSDDSLLVTGSLDMTCKIWDVQNQFELLCTIQGHTQGINGVALSQNVKYLATCSTDQTCKIWDISKLQKKNQKSSIKGVNLEAINNQIVNQLYEI